MRRAMRHGKRLGTTEPFLYTLVDVLVDQLGAAYPELPANRDAILRVVRSEEDRFDAVLSGGLSRLEEVLDRAAARGGTVSGDEAFKLYDTFGLPLDFIEDLASERRLAFDRESFDRAMDAQRQKARAGSAFDQKRSEDFVPASDAERQRLQTIGDTFDGYTTTSVDKATVAAVFDADRKQVDRLRAGSAGFVLLDRTPFYVESGGQVSDVGELRDANGSLFARVDGVVRTVPGWPRAQRVQVEAGELHPGAVVIAAVTDEVRDATRRNHTATHLLHAALRQVLGAHVKQAGSLVAPDRLRFDFAHQGFVTREQLDEIERIVNRQVYRNVPVATEVRATADAMAAGAMALFGEKYGDRVRVVSIPGFSMELCGGTHVTATGDIGPFVIIEEGGVAAGVRRIEALTGAGAVHAQQEQRQALDRVLGALGVGEAQAVESVAKLQAEVKKLTRDLRAVRLDTATKDVTVSPPTAELGIKGLSPEVAVHIQRVEGFDKSALRDYSDSIKSKMKSGIVVLASATPDAKVAIVVSVTPDLKGRLHAGNIVKQIAPIVGGGGGGRPDFAEAGGKEPGKIDAMLAESRNVIEKMAATA
jgi:alanyl-tRNA synthetase